MVMVVAVSQTSLRRVLASMNLWRGTSHIKNDPKMLMQVSKASTARLICDLGASMTNWLNDNQANWEAEQKSMVRVQAVKNLSANVFVQCMRQEGLIQV